MGLLRFLLSLIIVIVHASPSASIFGYRVIGGDVTVRLFFIISGFYMALILNEKYTQKSGSYLLFLTNRFLRIYPIYWIILLLTIAGSIIYNHFGLEYGFDVRFYHNALFYGAPFDILRDITILWRTDFITLNPALIQVMVVGRAWSLAIELLFYIVAPFIVRRNTKTIMILTGFFIIVKLLTFVVVRLNHWWPTDRFFPADLAYFMLGSVAYQLYAKIKYKAMPPLVLWCISVGFISILLLYSLIPWGYRFHGFEFKDGAYLVLLTGAIPFLFLATKRKGIDRRLGDLSYPFI